jgi:hypothetical protein
VHISTLPEGWLGKCRAMHVGVPRATGELLLFTDGDVAFAPALPVAAFFDLWALRRSAWITLRQGGVRWRDTFYPLKVLRRGLPR